MDFGTIKIQANTNSSTPYGEGGGSATWTDWAFGGSSGLNEIRFCASGAGGASIASASWPFYTVPGSVGVVPEVWLYGSSDNSGGLQVHTYDGTGAHYNQFRFSWTNDGTFASAPSYSMYAATSHPAAVPGSTTIVNAGDPIVNGNNTDTGNGTSGSATSYCKSAVYGYGVDTGGTQQTPSANAGNTGLSATTGSANSVTSGSAAWSNWQSLQSASQFITCGVIPHSPGTAGLWYFLLALYSGPGMLTSSAITPVLTFSYTYV